MKLSSRCEYALLALVYLARKKEAVYVPVTEIAAAQHIPVKFLGQILRNLTQAGILKSVKGKGGGYCLAKKAKAISLAEVVRLIDGALAPTESVSRFFYERTPIRKDEALTAVFKDIRDYIAFRLENTTLAKLVSA